MAKYDQNYDVRDRARFLRQLVQPEGEVRECVGGSERVRGGKGVLGEVRECVGGEGVCGWLGSVLGEVREMVRECVRGGERVCEWLGSVRVLG